MTSLRINTPRVFAPLLKPARFKGAKGGRGSGKSHFFAESIVEACILRPGLRVLCAREIQKSLKESAKKLIEDKIEALGVGHLFEVLQTEIRGPGGGSIMFAGLRDRTADSIKSYEGIDICWIEEAQSITTRSLGMLVPTIRKDGSEIWLSWNPRKRSDAVEVLFRTNPERAILVHANYMDNPYCPEVLRVEAEASRDTDPDAYDHIWLGGFESAGSLTVIPLAWIEAAIGLAQDLGLDISGKRYAALDVAGGEDGGDENAQAIRHGIELQFIDKWNGLDTGLTTHRAVGNMAAHDVLEGYYDSVGVGEGVTGEWAGMGRRGERNRDMQLIAWNGGAAVLEPDARTDKRNPKSPRNKDQYANLKAQAWFAARRRFENAFKARQGREYDPDMLISIPRDLPHLDQLKDELNQAEHKVSALGKTMIDKQPDGTRSPNLADSVIMAFHPCGGKRYNMEAFT